MSTRCISVVEGLKEEWGLSRTALAAKLKLPVSLVRDADEGVIFEARRMSQFARAVAELEDAPVMSIIVAQTAWQKSALRASQLKYKQLAANSQ